MDSVDIAQDTTETVQPDAAVAAKSEEVTQPQGDVTDPYEVIVEGEEVQNDTSKEDVDWRAVAKQEREKRKAKNEEIEARDRRIAALEEQISGVTSKVSEFTRGPRPQSIDFPDDDSFIEALEKWNGHGKPQKKEEPAQQQGAQTVQLPDEAMVEVDAERMKASRTDKDFKKFSDTARDELAKVFGVTNAADVLAYEASLMGINTAAVERVVGTHPKLAQEIAANYQNKFALRKVLQDIAGKYKVTAPKSVQTRPEESITGNGSVDSNQKRVDQARQKWIESGSQADYRAYSELKKKVNANG